MISTRKEELRTAINRAERELARLESLPDFDQLVDGTVAALFVTYGPSRPYTVIAFKTGNRWYLTGKNSPNKIDSDALAGWLSIGGRTLIGATVLAEVTTESIPAGVVFDLGEALAASLSERSFRGRSSEGPPDDDVYEEDNLYPNGTRRY